MEKHRRLGAPEEPSELNLPACGIQQILAAHHHVHALQPIVDDDRKLIRPAAVPIADEDIAALFVRALLLETQPEIMKTLDGTLRANANAEAGRFRQLLIAARSEIRPRSDIGARTLARVNKVASPKIVERAIVKRTALALPGQFAIGREPEPCQILEDRLLELRAAARPIVIFNAQQHTRIGPARTRDIPHVNRVEHVPQMQVPGRAGGEPSDQGVGIGD